MTLCKKCIMDLSDQDIFFDENGICNHCYKFENIQKPNLDKGIQYGIKNLFNSIKMDNKDQKYDCIIGLSGGIDSSYLLKIVVDNGLNPLCVHVDGGWNSALAVKNIISLVKKLNVDLYTVIIDWQTMKYLQLALLEAGVANQDVAQDHAYFANLYFDYETWPVRSLP